MIRFYVFPKEYLEPLDIVVDETRWDAYGPATTRSSAILNVLNSIGGINESVPPGNYHFNVRRVGLNLETSLTPAETTD